MRRAGDAEFRSLEEVLDRGRVHLGNHRGLHPHDHRRLCGILKQWTPLSAEFIGHCLAITHARGQGHVEIDEGRPVADETEVTHDMRAEDMPGDVMEDLAVGHEEEAE